MAIEGSGLPANLADLSRRYFESYRMRISSSHKVLKIRAREDLTFIERAVFAMHLEDAGHDRSVVQEALSIDRAEASKLVSVARCDAARSRRGDRPSTQGGARPMASPIRCSEKAQAR